MVDRCPLTVDLLDVVTVPEGIPRLDDGACESVHRRKYAVFYVASDKRIDDVLGGHKRDEFAVPDAELL